MATGDEWDAQVRAGMDNTWIHSDHKNVSAYNLGQSLAGWGSKSSWAGPNPSSSQNTWADFGGSTPPNATASASTSVPFTSSRSSRSAAAFGGRHGGAKREIVWWFLKFIFILGFFFGIHDCISNKSDIDHSITVASGTVYKISDVIGKKIEAIGPEPFFAWAGWGVRWGLAIPGGLAAGAGAGVGSLGSDVAIAIYQSYTSSRHGN
jgi:hypothetical protein